MNMIDITQPPLTSAEIEARKQECQREIDTLSKRQRLWAIFLIVALVLYVCLTISLGLSKQLMPWSYVIAVSVLSLVPALTLGALLWLMAMPRIISTIILAAVPALFFWGCLQDPFAHVAYFVGVLGACGGWSLSSVWRIDTPLDNARKILAWQEAAPLSTCKEVQTWLDDPTIREYRDAVIEQRRAFTTGEVDAMREWCVTRTLNSAALIEQKRIHSAAQTVYCDALPAVTQA
jgi:hypothetical protein